MRVSAAVFVPDSGGKIRAGRRLFLSQLNRLKDMTKMGKPFVMRIVDLAAQRGIVPCSKRGDALTGKTRIEARPQRFDKLTYL